MHTVGGAVRIKNVNDFIMPNVKCVVGLPTANTTENQKNEIKIHSKKSDGIVTTAEAPARKPVRITLSDCMSCTGCLTSSEELFQAQDINEFKKGLDSDARVKVVTLSPQSIISIATHRGLEPTVAAAAIAIYLKSIGIHYVLDSSFARELTQQKMFEEFSKPQATVPLITGVCPGVVAYAEKNESKTLMSQLAVTRSPMLISGALVKDYLNRSLNVAPSNIFHACVMPCFDKKLEAFRNDAKLSDGTQLVDCVVTTVEFEEFVPKDLTPYISEIKSVSDSTICWTNTLEHGIIQGSLGLSTSGSYAEYVVDRLERELPAIQINKKKIYEGIEFHVTDPDSKLDKLIVILNGYRNFQRVVNQIKTGNIKYDFVELMACPGGCANGAGQVRSEKPHENKKILDDVTAAYRNISSNQSVSNMFNDIKNMWCEANPTFDSYIFAKYEAVRVNELIEAANAW